jgi:hypothetical protein
MAVQLESTGDEDEHEHAGDWDAWRGSGCAVEELKPEPWIALATTNKERKREQEMATS